MNRIRAGVLTPAIALALVAVAAPANAATKTFDFSGDNEPVVHGSASTAGTFNFTSTSSLTTTFTVTDNCPADGWSSGVFFEINATDGYSKTTQTYWDSDGCGNGPSNYSFTYSIPGHKILSARAKLIMQDRDNMSTGVLVATGALKDNPLN